VGCPPQLGSPSTALLSLWYRQEYRVQSGGVSHGSSEHTPSQQYWPSLHVETHSPSTHSSHNSAAQEDSQAPSTHTSHASGSHVDSQLNVPGGSSTHSWQLSDEHGGSQSHATHAPSTQHSPSSQQAPSQQSVSGGQHSSVPQHVWPSGQHLPWSAQHTSSSGQQVAKEPSPQHCSNSKQQVCVGPSPQQVLGSLQQAFSPGGPQQSPG
jgi:hypothetical protein